MSKWLRKHYGILCTAFLLLIFVGWSTFLSIGDRGAASGADDTKAITTDKETPGSEQDLNENSSKSHDISPVGESADMVGNDESGAAPEQDKLTLTEADATKDTLEEQVPDAQNPDKVMQTADAQTAEASEQEPGTQAEDTSEQEPGTQAEDTSEQEPGTQAEGASGQEPGTQAEGASEQEPGTQAEGASGQEPGTQAEGTSEQEPDTQGTDAVVAETDAQSYDNFRYILANVTENLNVRSGPGENYSIIARMKSNYYAECIEDKGEWLKIKSGSVTGYIKKEYALTGKDAYDYIVQNGFFKVTVNASVVNIRILPNTECDVIRAATSGESFEILPLLSDSEWYAIRYDDTTTGYVAKQFMKENFGLKTALTI